MKCVICGNEIIDPRQGKKYCNAAYCQNKNNQKLVRESSIKPLLIKNCLNCGKEFETRRELQKNCSSECGEIYFGRKFQKRNAERTAETARKYYERKKAKIEAELNGKTFSQALAEKYGLEV